MGERTMMDVAEVARAVMPLLPAHLARQRWYGAKHRGEVEIRLVIAEELEASGAGLVRMVIEAVGAAAVDPGGGSAAGERYQLFVGVQPAERAGGVPGDTAAIGLVDTAAGPCSCFDALTDPRLGLAILRHVAPGQEVSIVRSVNAEQSNTSLVYDERLILKIFRRLSGANPEIEVTLGLAEHGFTNIAEPVAAWRTSGDDLAVLQRFLAGGVEGWALAMTSVRDVLDHGIDPAVAGGDLAPEAERLGVVTAELHLAMGKAFGVVPGDAAAWADAAAERMASVDHAGVDAGALGRALEVARSLSDAGAAIRIHGDYHLGQVMRTDEGWFILDFEGEPARPVEERRSPSSPLRDVAGMLRSFGYAAAVGAAQSGADPDLVAGSIRDGGAPTTTAELAHAWEQRNREAFLVAYLARLEGSALMPADMASTRVLLTLFELDKAVYEVGYEQAHRPGWVPIPLAAVYRLLGSGAAPLPGALPGEGSA